MAVPVDRTAVATARLLAATVASPCVLVAAAILNGRLTSDTHGDLDAERFLLAGAGALAVQAVLLWSLVSQARARRPAVRGTPGSGATTAAAVAMALSVLYVALPPLAMFVFIAALVATVPAGIVAVPCAFAAATMLASARRRGAEPDRAAAALAATAGWLVAVVGMPVAGGVFMLSLGGS